MLFVKVVFTKNDYIFYRMKVKRENEMDMNYYMDSLSVCKLDFSREDFEDNVFDDFQKSDFNVFRFGDVVLLGSSVDTDEFSIVV